MEQRQAGVREIHRTAWLQSADNPQRLWGVLCVHDSLDPRLELYPHPRAVSSHNPVRSVSLIGCRHVTPTLHPRSEFCVALPDESLCLSAPTWEDAVQWVSTLRSTLQQLSILAPPENDYTRPPGSEGRITTRDPNSPLPPPPPPITPRSAATVDTRPQGTSTFNFEAGHYERVVVPDLPPRPRTRSLSEGSAPTLQPPPHPRTLRDMQVQQLQREMRHPGGVRLQLRRRDCDTGLALVDTLGAVWVAGWKQKLCPALYSALHIGDQIVRVAGTPVYTAADVRRMVRSAPGLYVEFVLRRVPFGQVFSLRRDADGSLGLDVAGGTSEVCSVTPNGPAARHGLSARSPACDGHGDTGWVLTEVNNRPLNLFARNGEARDRLNAVGTDISILVQPYDLVSEIKRKLKALRGYKDYIVQ